MPEASSRPAATPRVTTVVMTRDRWQDLAWSLPRQQPPVIVVDNASSDDTPLRAQQMPGVEVIPLIENLGAPARNRGVKAAETPYVAFADDDSWWEPGALELAADLFDAHPRLGLLAARVLIGEDAVDPTCAEMAASPLPPTPGVVGVPVLGFVACGAVVRREAFLEAGGFDPVVRWPGEEERLALDLVAAGWDVVYEEHVVAHHRPSSLRQPPLARRALEERNALLTAVMRRPWRVIARTATAMARGDTGARLGLVRAVPRLPRALRARRQVPPELEARRALLDGLP